MPTEFTNVEGKGVQGVVDGRAVLVGRETLLAGWAQHLPRELADAKARAEEQGGTAVVVGWDGQARGILVVADAVKPTSAEAIRQLRALGLTPVLLTGDNATVARRIAAEVGIDEVIAEVMPSDKVDVVSRLQGEGKVVAMVGDGVNDAAALAQADLGLAMGTGTDVAIEAADITLVRGDLRSAADAIRLARRTLRTIKVNLFWAFAYNVAAIPWRPSACSTRCSPVPPWRSRASSWWATACACGRSPAARRADRRSGPSHPDASSGGGSGARRRHVADDAHLDVDAVHRLGDRDVVGRHVDAQQPVVAHAGRPGAAHRRTGQVGARDADTGHAVEARELVAQRGLGLPGSFEGRHGNHLPHPLCARRRPGAGPSVPPRGVE